MLSGLRTKDKDFLKKKHKKGKTEGNWRGSLYAGRDSGRLPINKVGVSVMIARQSDCSSLHNWLVEWKICVVQKCDGLSVGKNGRNHEERNVSICIL